MEVFLFFVTVIHNTGIYKLAELRENCLQFVARGVTNCAYLHTVANQLNCH